MSGVDRIGSGKVPTGPLQSANGASAPAVPGVPGEAKADAPKDHVAPPVKGKKSKIRASEEIPRAADAADLPAAVAAHKADLPPALASLLESGLPIKGLPGLRRLAERLLGAGVAGVKTAGGKPVGLSGDALAKLKVKVSQGDHSDVVKPADLGLTGVSFG